VKSEEAMLEASLTSSEQFTARISKLNRKDYHVIGLESLATDVGDEGEHLVYGQDLLSPGHILNAYTVDSGDEHCDSFIISKIKQAKPTGHKFAPRFGWTVEF